MNKNIKNFLASESLFKKQKQLVNNKVSIIGSSKSNFQINPSSHTLTQQKNYVNYLKRQQDNHQNLDQHYQRNDNLPPTIKKLLFNEKLSKNKDFKLQEKPIQPRLKEEKINQYFGYAFEINNAKDDIDIKDMELTNSLNLSKSSISKDKIEHKQIATNNLLIENSSIKKIQSNRSNHRQPSLHKETIKPGFQTIKQQSIAYLTKLKHQLQASYRKLQSTDKLIYNSVLNNIKNQLQKIKYAFVEMIDKSIEKFIPKFNANQKRMKMTICPQLEEIKSNMESRFQQINLLEKQFNQKNWQYAFNNLIDYTLQKKILFTIEKQKQIEQKIKNIVIVHEDRLKIEIFELMKNSIQKKFTEITDQVFKHVQLKQLYLHLQKMSELS